MKIQFISLLLFTSAALARPLPVDKISSVPMARRTLIGDEYTVQNQIDNSRGKHTFRVDHNGDSSVRKGLLYDLASGSHGGRGEQDDNGTEFQRRSLLGDLFGGDSTSVSNVNDNSKHSQTINEHGNRHTTIKKVHKEYRGSSNDGRVSEMSPESFFDKRDMVPTFDVEKRGLLFGGDSTSISNVNDNSQHTQTMNKHGNKDTRITTKVHKEVDMSRGRDHDEMSPEEFFDRRDLTSDSESEKLKPRSLFGDLFGGSSTTISNVNDNSQTKKTFNSHGNRDTRINTKTDRITRNKKQKRGLLFGDKSMRVNNGNYNGKEAKTYNSYGNVDKSISRIVEKKTVGGRN